MEDDGFTGRTIVLEAHGGHQVYEESVALLPELSVLADESPGENEKKRRLSRGRLSNVDVSESL